MNPKPRQIRESPTQVVYSNLWISERKTYFHKYGKASRLLPGGSGIRFPTEGRRFSLILNGSDCSVTPTQSLFHCIPVCRMSGAILTSKIYRHNVNVGTVPDCRENYIWQKWCLCLTVNVFNFQLQMSASFYFYVFTSVISKWRRCWSVAGCDPCFWEEIFRMGV